VEKIYNVLLDTKDDVKNPAFVVNTNDLKTVKINLLINQDGDPLDLTGATVRLAVKKPDKTTVLQDFTVIDALAGSCEIVLNTQAYVIDGKYDAEVMVYYGVDTVAVTGRFSYQAVKGILDDGTVESTNEWQSINQAIADAEAILVDLRTNGTGVDAQARADLVESAKKTDMILSVKQYGAVADGISNDTTFFNSFESSVKGQVVDLGNKTYVVDSIPKKNAYFNGIFKVSGSTRPAVLFNTFASGVPKRHIFGGQLAKLKESLANPLEQITGIVFVGDSITWGRTLAENAVFDPRDGTLSDPRDNFASPSYVNEFKRYLGANYAFNATPVLYNWPASLSGEAIAEYTVQHVLYPKDGDFSYSVTGTSVSTTETATPASITGFQFRLDAASTGTGEHTVSFPFTGDRFTLAFGATTDALDYELFVDGVSKGVFSTTPGVAGVVEGNNNQREHVFNYVRNKTIQIKTRQAGYVGTGKLRLEGVIVNKKIRITNQGINGATTTTYKNYNLAGNTFSDGEAVGPQDNFVFCQLGTNDRITRTDTPKGENKFKSNLKLALDKITPLANVILMCANPAVDESTSTYSFNMQRCRDVIFRTAKENNIDMIDNYAVFGGIDMNVVTSDGLHPNNIGMQVIARNIINSLEYS
jgi:lysophospholipase L1-like esterase